MADERQVADTERLNSEWEGIQAHVKFGDQRDWEKAVRWVLVQVFGTEHGYLFDPMFHAKVSAAEQMIWRLQELHHNG